MMSRFSVSGVVNGISDQPKVVLSDQLLNQTCDVHLLGCTITSWKSKDSEKLFLSELAIFNGVKAIRGGIPLVFPQFGQPSQTMPQHGFARTTVWTVNDTITTDTSITTSFGISYSEATLNVWPHKFNLTYHVTLSDAGLTTQLDIQNVDTTSFDCQALLHTYLRVPDIHRTVVAGFKAFQFVDKMASSEEFTDDRIVADFTQEVDRIYVGQLEAPFSVDVITNEEQQVNVRCSSSILRGDSRRSVPTDCVLWNAWVDKTASIADLNDDAYLQYVCVEPGVVKGVTTVQAGEVLVLSQTLSLPVSA
jgi:glucose-6-phosphate 1-epimerase